MTKIQLPLIVYKIETQQDKPKQTSVWKVCFGFLQQSINNLTDFMLDILFHHGFRFFVSRNIKLLGYRPTFIFCQVQHLIFWKILVSFAPSFLNNTFYLIVSYDFGLQNKPHHFYFFFCKNKIYRRQNKHKQNKPRNHQKRNAKFTIPGRKEVNREINKQQECQKEQKNSSIKNFVFHIASTFLSAVISYFRLKIKPMVGESEVNSTSYRTLWGLAEALYNSYTVEEG
ncbi:MAG: hypothetical protein IKM34_01510 [Clostridia bacterium]|nr:hypothetical protein [Clostridia bacterium]